MNRAVIQNSRVINLVTFTDQSPLGITLPAGQLLWDCGDLPVAIGDQFVDGVFLRGGQPLSPQPSLSQQLEEARQESLLLTLQITQLDYRLSLIELAAQQPEGGNA